MADVTISELAGVVGVSADKLLSQVKEAGLPHEKAGDVISNEDKNTLLVFLRRGHGDSDATDGAPKKITLKRKTIATLKSASTHGRGKTVAVEVRKKRTYVKRSEIPEEAAAEEAAAALAAALAAAEEAAEAAEAAAAAAAAEAEKAAAVEKVAADAKVAAPASAPAATKSPADSADSKQGAKRKAPVKPVESPDEKKKGNPRNKG
ncbi:MAG: translation initiation factor IF-2, partial [Pseudohongiellaceae bacterium]